jgi:hypothetical protein
MTPNPQRQTAKSMKAHFVTFESPGTFFHESTQLPIYDWDVDLAAEMAHSIKERYNATPFAFYFTTRERKEHELDSKVIKTSGRYFLGGKVETLEEVKRRNDPKEEILVSNMEGNHWGKIVINTNSWKVAQPLLAEDTVLDWSPAQPPQSPITPEEV